MQERCHAENAGFSFSIDPDSIIIGCDRKDYIKDRSIDDITSLYMLKPKSRIDKMNYLGVPVSYSRVLELSTQLGNSLCAIYEEQTFYFPSSLRH